MSNLNLIREQILLRLPDSVWILSSSDSMAEDSKELVYLEVEHFGRITMYRNFDIQITYTNPLNVRFEYLREFFDSRLKFENASSYFYEDRISIFKRVMSDHERNDFENSMQRAMNFIQAANTVMSFLEYSQSSQNPEN